MHPSLGRIGTDRITGFKGTVTGYCQYLTGCNQLLLSGKADKSGKYDAHWFDEQRVTLTGKAITLDNGNTPGPDKPAPIR